MSNLPYPTQPGYPPDPNAQPPYGQPPPYAPSAPPAPGQYPPAPYPPGPNQQPYPQGGQNFIKKFLNPRMQCCHGLILKRFLTLSKYCLLQSMLWTVNDFTRKGVFTLYTFSIFFLFLIYSQVSIKRAVRLTT